MPTDDVSPLDEVSPLASVDADERKDEELQVAVDQDDTLDELEEFEELEAAVVEKLEAAVDKELEAAVDKEAESDQSPLSSTGGLFNSLSEEEELQRGGAGAGVSEAESRRRSRSPRRPRPATKAMPVLGCKSKAYSRPHIVARGSVAMVPQRTPSWLTRQPPGPPPSHLLALQFSWIPAPPGPLVRNPPPPLWGPWPLHRHLPACQPADTPPGSLPEATAQVQLVVCLMVVAIRFGCLLLLRCSCCPQTGAALTGPPLLCLWATSPPTMTLGATAPPPTLRPPSSGVMAARSCV